MSFNKHRIVSVSLRFVACLSVIALVSLTASAYTLVLRDGRRMTIPDEFVVTSLTLTYTAGERIQLTLQLAIINIPATERANNEPAGSFLKRAQTPLPAPAPVTSVGKRQVTNRDFEKFRSARLKSEADYERRRKELGLPSLEELRKQSLAQVEQTARAAREIRTQEQEAESYWRARASELRADLTATNARIDFVRARLNEIPANAPLGILATDVAFGTVRTAGFGPVLSTGVIQRSPLSINQRGTETLSRFSARGGSHVGGRIRLGVGGRRGHFGLGRARFNGFRRLPGAFPFPNTLLAIPFQDYSYERSELMVQLDELLGHRAELQARWRDLEEEARRAGAYPGWLRR